MKLAVKNGEVESWFGLCHGWAPVAFLEPQAGTVARVRIPSGQEIDFYASDIKSLVVKVYADAKLDSYFLGGRCNEKAIQRDSQGRPVSQKCRDTNPGSFQRLAYFECCVFVAT